MTVNAQQNIKLYPWFIAASSLLFWFPVFFLYFSSKVTIDQVLVLEAIYYISVVLLEVPSGYASDLLGRRITLIASSICALISYIVFFIADSFIFLAFAQVFLAAHISFKSGTDSSLLYESLVETSQQQATGYQLAKAQRYGLLATALAALIGGLAGGFNLAIPYALAAAGAVATVVLSLKFYEPTKLNKAHSVINQANEIKAYLKKSTLAWLFFFNVVIFVLVHVPYEYFQPYIKLLFPTEVGYDNSPLVGGILIAITMAAGSYASNFSIPLQQRFGTGSALIIIIIYALIIVFAMAVYLHIAILLIVLMRSIPMALANPIVNSVLHENIHDQIRASFLSVLSLFSRLSFSLTLLLTAYFTDSIQQFDFPKLQTILAVYVLVVLIILPILWKARLKLIKKEPD